MDLSSSGEDLVWFRRKVLFSQQTRTACMYMYMYIVRCSIDNKPHGTGLATREIFAPVYVSGPRTGSLNNLIGVHPVLTSGLFLTDGMAASLSLSFFTKERK